MCGEKPKYTVDQEYCIGCRKCYELATDNFSPDPDSRFASRSQLVKQPEDDNEEFLCKEAFEGCPTDAILKVVDGKGYDKFDNPVDVDLC